MSTWVTDKATIKAALPNDYKEVPYKQTLEEAAKSHNHKVYEINLLPSDRTEISNNAELSSRLVQIRIMYRIANKDTYDSNRDLFETVYSGIKDLTAFMGLQSESFERDPMDRYKVIGTLEFYFGLQAC